MLLAYASHRVRSFFNPSLNLECAKHMLILKFNPTSRIFSDPGSTFPTPRPAVPPPSSIIEIFPHLISKLSYKYHHEYDLMSLSSELTSYSHDESISLILVRIFSFLGIISYVASTLRTTQLLSDTHVIRIKVTVCHNCQGIDYHDPRRFIRKLYVYHGCSRCNNQTSFCRHTLLVALSP